MAANLDRDRIVDAGREVVRQGGWAALSIRSVSARMSVTPMALYRHVTDSDALRSSVLEAIVHDLAEVVETGDVHADLTDWTRRFHADLDRYPGVAAHLLTAWFDCPPMLERIEALLAMLAGHGIDGFEAVACVNALMMYALMRSEAERVVRQAGVVRRTLRTAGSRPLPHLRALAEHYTTARFDAHFEYGLCALVEGMQLAVATR